MKKKIIVFSIIILAIAILIPMSTRATTIEVSKGNINGLSYTVCEEYGERYVIITGYNNSEASITVPEKIEDYPVTRIEENAFFKGTIEEINLPQSLTSIGFNAFSECINLKTIKIPNRVTKIDIEAFENCTNLETVEIPNSVSAIKSDAFKNCTSLKTIDIPSSVTDLGYGVFRGCTSLTDITIQKGIATIPGQMLKDCVNVKTIEIPSTVYFISGEAFKNCTGLENVKFPNRDVSIGHNAFENCTSLKEIDIPMMFTIGEYAFYNCTNLTDVKLGSKLITIGTYAFARCSNLSNIEIPYSVENIEGWTFYGCNKLLTIFIPQKTSLGVNVFCDWTENQTINIEADKESSSWSEGWNSNCNAKINYGTKKITQIYLNKSIFTQKIPEQLNVTIIPENAHNKKLEYKSSNEEIFTIDEDGIITPISNGTASVTISTTDGSNISITRNIRIKFLVTDIILDKTEIVFNDLNTTQDLNITVVPDYALDKTIYYENRNPQVAKISGNTITPLANGECYIRCYTDDGSNVSKLCRIIVDIKADKLELNEEKIIFNYITHQQTLTANISPAETKNKEVKWESTNPEIATVDENGIVTPVNNGTCEIICKTQDGSNLIKKCEVIVDFKVTGLKLNNEKLVFNNKEDSYQLEVKKVYPEHANNKKVKWETLGSGVVEVDENGKVTPIGNGTDSIICSTTDGSGVTTQCSVEVWFNIQKIELNKTSLEFEDTEIQEVIANVMPAEATEQHLIKWESTNPKVATVEFGRITPVNYGTCEIICYYEPNPEIQDKCTVTVKYKEKPLYARTENQYNPKTNTVTTYLHTSQPLVKIPANCSLSADGVTYISKSNQNGTNTIKVEDIYGNEKEITYTINEIDEKAPNITIKKTYDYNTKTVKVEAISDEEFWETKPTWKLSESKKIYTKTYDTNGEYSTAFSDIYGNSCKITFTINEIDNEIPNLTINKTYDAETNTVTVNVVSNEILKETKPTWKLSEDKKTYTKTYNANGTYSTIFMDLSGNEKRETFSINNIEFRYNIIKEYNSKTNTVKVSLINNVGLQETKPTWKLSEDKKTYTKTYDANGQYSTLFVDTFGNSKQIEFVINEIDHISPNLSTKMIYDAETNTVKVQVTSNELLGETKPTWTLSEDKLTYSKIYNLNGTYTTTFKDIYGNSKILTFTVEEIQSKYEIQKLYDEKTNTVIVSVINNFGMQETKPTWTLSGDKTTYTKKYTEKGTYTTTFVDSSGNKKTLTFTV